MTFGQRVSCTLLVCGLVVLAYANSFTVPFQFDDFKNIVHAQEIHKFDPSAIFAYSKSRVLPYLSFALNYEFGQEKVFGYHAVNLGIHLLATLSFFWLALITFASKRVALPAKLSPRWVALFAALVFGLHPIQTESVTYIFQRAESMAGFFFLLAMAAYAASRLSHGMKRVGLYGLCLAATCAAFFSKPNAVMIPFAILIYEIVFLSQSRRDFGKAALFILPIFAMGFLPAALSVIDPHEMNNTGFFSANQKVSVRFTPTFMPYYYTKLRVLLMGIGLLAFPHKQTLDYGLEWSKSLTDPIETLYALGAILLMIVGAIFLRKRFPLGSFGILFYFTTTLVTSLLFLGDVFFEHYLYLPTVAWALFLAGATAWVVRRIPFQRFLWLSMCIAITGSYMFATIERNKVWQSGIELWEDTVQKAPQKARPHYILGVHYYWDRQLEKAFQQYRNALEIKPRYPELHYRFGQYYMLKGEWVLAVSSYSTATILKPDFFDAHMDLGLLYFDLGRYDKARQSLTKAGSVAYNMSDTTRLDRMLTLLEEKSGGSFTL